MTPGGSGVDVLIVGGGIYGATAAYEASRRGLSVLLVERDDFGAATSQNSMKIAHGGLRYLQTMDLPRIRESIEERQRLLQIAPHLVKPLLCRIDLEGVNRPSRLLLRAGLLLNEWISRAINRTAPADSLLPKAAYPYWYDAIIIDTERLLLSFLDTAVKLGRGRTRVMNYTIVEEFIRRRDRIAGARISALGEVDVGFVLDCTGVSRRGQPAGLSMNLVVGGLSISGGGAAVALHHPIDHRKVFVVPWRECSIVGTMERAYPYDPAQPLRLDRAWIDEFLAWIRPVHPELARLSSADIRLVHAGLLPREGPHSNRLARHYRIEDEPGGIVRVVGVKYTTARRVSSRAVEIGARRLGLRPGPGRESGPLPSLVDHRLELAAYQQADAALPAAVLDSRSGPSVGAVLYAVDREQARTLSDVLFRRTGIATTGHPGPDLVSAVASILQQRFGWSEEQRREQIEAFNRDRAYLCADPHASTRS